VDLGLSFGYNTESIHVKGQLGEKTIFYTCDAVREMIGYLEGLTMLAESRTEP